MRSVADDKHRAALKLVRRWRFGNEKGREETLKKLAEPCAVEISSGLREGGGVLAWSTREHTTAAVRHVALAGVRRALETVETYTTVRPRDFPRYVQGCTAKVARETKSAQEAALKELEPQQILDSAFEAQFARQGLDWNKVEDDGT
jgi:hypothetical protein